MIENFNMAEDDNGDWVIEYTYKGFNMNQNIKAEEVYQVLNDHFTKVVENKIINTLKAG